MGIFGFPMALWALASLPTLGVIYWMRNRYRSVTVSSLYLWETETAAKEGGRRFQRIQTGLLFWLELVALALMVIAAATPIMPLAGTTRHLIVVLDDSWSMQGRAADRTFRETAIERLTEEWNRYKSTRLTLIAAGRHPYRLGSNIEKAAQLTEVLEQWHCQSDQANWSEALALGRDLRRGWSDMMVISDHLPEEAPEKVLWHSVGQAGGNVGFVSAYRRDNGLDSRLVIEIANFSDQIARGQLQIETPSADKNLLPADNYVLAAHSRKRLTFNLKEPGRVLKLNWVQADSALTVDDSVTLLPQRTIPLNVGITLKDKDLQHYFSKALRATGTCRFGESDLELLITDQLEFLGRSAPYRRVCVLAEAGAVSFSGPYVTDESSPLLEGTRLDKVVWAAAETSELSSEMAVRLQSGSPLVMVGDTPLVVAFPRSDGRRDYLLRWSPQFSTLQNSINFPVLVTNWVRIAKADRPGPERVNLRVGDLIKLRVNENAVSVTLIDPLQHRIEYDLSETPGRTLSLETRLIGLHTLEVHMPQNQTTTYQVAVNGLSAAESDLSQCRFDTSGSWNVTEQIGTVYRKSSWLWVLAALAVLLCHQLILARSGGSS